MLEFEGKKYDCELQSKSYDDSSKNDKQQMAIEMGKFDLYSCMGDHADEYMVKKFATDTKTETTKITITNPTDKDYMKKYTLDYVESGSGEKFTGKGIEF
jgi:hypothetical protein